MNIKFLKNRTQIRASLALSLIIMLAVFVTGSVPAVYAQGSNSGVAYSPLAISGTSFYSNFNSNHTGWTPVYGSWSVVSSAYYKTTGNASVTSSIKHIGTYRDFVYQARIMRTGNCDSHCGDMGLQVRGNPMSLGTYKDWLPEYWFAYTNNGYFHVLYWKSSGTWTNLKDWSYSSSIVQGGWNTLKVVAFQSMFGFYINGTLVWSGDKSTTPTGQVGIGFYRDSDRGTFYVDWAKLQTVTITPITVTTGIAPSISVHGGNAHQSP